jgi:hypothetical protein
MENSTHGRNPIRAVVNGANRLRKTHKKIFFLGLALLVLIPGTAAAAQSLLTFQTSQVTVTISPSFVVSAVYLSQDQYYYAPKTFTTCTLSSGIAWSCGSNAVSDYGGGNLTIAVIYTNSGHVSNPQFSYVLTGNSSDITSSTFWAPVSGGQPGTPTAGMPTSVAQGTQLEVWLNLLYPVNMGAQSFTVAEALSG